MVVHRKMTVMVQKLEESNEVEEREGSRNSAQQEHQVRVFICGSRYSSRLFESEMSPKVTTR